jgi:hypothetical protein
MKVEELCKTGECFVLYSNPQVIVSIPLTDDRSTTSDLRRGGSGDIVL